MGMSFFIVSVIMTTIRKTTSATTKYICDKRACFVPFIVLRAQCKSFNKLTGYKDSPVDCGLKTFLELFKKRE